MSTTDELSTREHDELRDLVLAGTQRIRPTGAHRAQFAAAGVALVLVGAVTGGSHHRRTAERRRSASRRHPGADHPICRRSAADAARRRTTFHYPNPNPGRRLRTIRSIEYTVPDGWEVGVTYVGKNLGQPNEVALSFWTTAGVYPDPCHWRGTELSPLDLTNHDHPDDGPPIVERSRHRSRGPARSDTDRTAPAPPAADGLDWQESGRCASNSPCRPTWISRPATTVSTGPGRTRAPPSRGTTITSPGQTDLVYEVDVDRSPLLIDASFRPGASPEDINELYAVLGSITINR